MDNELIIKRMNEITEGICCALETVYSKYWTKENGAKNIYIICGRWQFIKLIWEMFITTHKAYSYFRDLQLEISLEIPAANDKKEKNTIQQHLG